MLKAFLYQTLFFKKGNHNSLITVCVNFFEYTDNISAVLESIAIQTQPQIDLIIVEDKSAAKSLVTAEEKWLRTNAFRFNTVQLIQHKRDKGVSGIRDTSTRIATSPYVFFVNSNSLLYSRCLERCLEAIEADNKASMAYPIIEKIGGEECSLVGNRVWNTGGIEGKGFIDTMCLIRKKHLLEAGGYPEFSDTHNFIKEDSRLCHEFDSRGLYGIPVSEILGRYRLCSTLSTNKTGAQEGTKTHFPIISQSIEKTYETMEAKLTVSESLLFFTYDSPVVSVIIPVFNKIDYTLRCLRSLAQTVEHELAIEVIVVNDCSSDETKEQLEVIKGLTLINNANNVGFIHSCNAGASIAKGKYLYFLNNDTEVLPNAITSLVNVFETNNKVGAAGSKLVYPSGALQEAGGIIWNDSTGWNYGRNENPYDPKYNFMRSVDYCSGASLLVKREAFESLNGFEKDFSPAYYEDTDICFAMRYQLGLDVIYQPKSVVVHYEGVSSGTSTTSGTKQYQVVNADKFKIKWADPLHKHPVHKNSPEDVYKAAKRFQGDKTVLVIDSYVPFYDKESGSRRLFQILKLLRDAGYHVIFLPDDMQAVEPYVSELQSMQIEVLYTCVGFGTSPETQLRERLAVIDIAWVCRPDLMQRYLPVIKENKRIQIIYDTIDLHYLRMRRELELGLAPNSAEKEISWIDMMSLELKMSMKADITLTVTSIEKDILQQQGVRSVEVVPNIHCPYEGCTPEFEERSDILFIGGYNHLPNVDAVEWLCHEIMPIVWAEIPNVKLFLLGSNPPEKVKMLASKGVIIPGYVADVTQYFLNARVFVAPLRYGAGMKGKIGHSLEYALPLVSTSIGLEGMNLISGKDSIEANTTEEFAESIVQLYTNKEMWESISKASRQAIGMYSPKAVQKSLAEILRKSSRVDRFV